MLITPGGTDIFSYNAKLKEKIRSSCNFATHSSTGRKSVRRKSIGDTYNIRWQEVVYRFLNFFD